MGFFSVFITLLFVIKETILNDIPFIHKKWNIFVIYHIKSSNFVGVIGMTYNGWVFIQCHVIATEGRHKQQSSHIIKTVDPLSAL